MALAAGWIAIAAEPAPPVKALAAAAGAGLGMAVGLGAFFQAMVVGRMSIVAPISAGVGVLGVLIGVVLLSV